MRNDCGLNVTWSHDENLFQVEDRTAAQMEDDISALDRYGTDVNAERRWIRLVIGCVAVQQSEPGGSQIVRAIEQ